MTFNIDDDPINADCLRIIARMRAIAIAHPELTATEVRIAAEHAQLASLGGDRP